MLCDIETKVHSCIRGSPEVGCNSAGACRTSLIRVLYQSKANVSPDVVEHERLGGKHGSTDPWYPFEIAHALCVRVLSYVQ